MHLGKNGSDFFSPMELRSVLREYILKRNSRILEKFLPTTMHDVDRLLIDIAQVDIGGATHVSVDGAESRHVPKTMGGSRQEFEGQEFREKYVFTGTDYSKIRRLGTLEERQTAGNMVLKAQAQLGERLLNRAELLRSETIFDNQVTLDFEGNSQVITYGHPDFLRPSAGTAWSNVASNILGDLNNWHEFLADSASSGYVDLVISRATNRKIMNNTAIREIFRAHYENTGRGDMSPADNINTMGPAGREILSRFVGDFNIVVSDDYVHYATNLIAPAAAAQDEIVVRSLEGFAVGRMVMVQSRAEKKFDRLTVAAIDADNMTVTLSGDLDNAYGIGTQVVVRRQIVPDNKILLVARYDGSIIRPDLSFSGYADGENQEEIDMASAVGELALTRNTYFIDDEERVPGFFSQMNHLTKEDPPRVELISGMKGLPRVNYIEKYLVATIES